MSLFLHHHRRQGLVLRTVDSENETGLFPAAPTRPPEAIMSQSPHARASVVTTHHVGSFLRNVVVANDDWHFASFRTAPSPIDPPIESRPRASESTSLTHNGEIWQMCTSRGTCPHHVAEKDHTFVLRTTHNTWDQRMKGGASSGVCHWQQMNTSVWHCFVFWEKIPGITKLLPALSFF